MFMSANLTLQLQRLVASLRQGQERAKAVARPVLVSVSYPVPKTGTPLAIFASGSRLAARRNFWARPTEDLWLIGIGDASTLASGGESSLDEAERWRRSLLDDAVIYGTGIRGTGPVFLGGFRFDPLGSRDSLWDGFPSGLLTLPRFLFTWSGGNLWLTVNVLMQAEQDYRYEARCVTDELELLASDSTPISPKSQLSTELQSPKDEWLHAVQQALIAIQDGDLTKVVLSRQKTLYSERPFSLESVLDRLLTSYPECAVFGFDNGDASFVGATPETLIRLEGETLSLLCLAGTTARGATIEEDEQLALKLLQSTKQRREHTTVVSTIAEALGEACYGLQWDTTPWVTKLDTVQHLASRFTGRSRKPGGIFHLVSLLHPTPAVGGVPKEEALETIRRLEGDRGWYAAPIGWTDCRGEGEFNVAIRSALLRANQATLFAGSGIVRGSDPDQEFQETELKFQPLLRALREG
jgi:menaquinone-specific isochorismate synthase